MSYVFDALQQAQRQSGHDPQAPWDPSQRPAAKEDRYGPDTRSVVQGPNSAEADTLSLHPRPEDRLVALGDQRGLGAEKFRVLASRVRQAQKQLGFRRLLITSSTIGDGKSLVSSNLGLSMARYAGYRVLMIDTDSRRGQLSALMDSKSAPGLQDWLLQGGGDHTLPAPLLRDIVVYAIRPASRQPATAVRCGLRLESARNSQ